jgi:hypothetical protein
MNYEIIEGVLKFWGALVITALTVSFIIRFITQF